MQVHLKNDGKTVWVQEWKEVGGKRVFFRSRAEYRYALYLEYLKQRGDIEDWFHEKKTFHFPNQKQAPVNYKPDFEVRHKGGILEYVEIKGHETGRDRSKWKKMAKYFPEVNLRVVRMDFFVKNSKALKSLLSDW